MKLPSFLLKPKNRNLQNCHETRGLVPGFMMILCLKCWARKNQFNPKQIIQILQPIIIDNFSTHSYKVDIS